VVVFAFVSILLLYQQAVAASLRSSRFARSLFALFSDTYLT
jgi:hypothetical protein